MSGRSLKRAFDVAFAIGAAPLWGSATLLGALAVYVDSGRPIFFVQTRMGKQSRPFEMLKLRTMRPGKPPPGGALFEGWTYRDDPRVTRAGRVLRRFRVDELPQFWNVLRGDMSVVGPRPEPWQVAVELSAQIPEYSMRHRVLPGLTGLCQIHEAYYDFGTLEKARAKVAYDLNYVENVSLWLDLWILLRSIPVLLRGAGVS